MIKMVHKQNQRIHLDDTHDPNLKGVNPLLPVIYFINCNENCIKMTQLLEISKWDF
jgi:hypothetical protein